MDNNGKKDINRSETLTIGMLLNLHKFIPKDLRIRLNEKFRYGLFSKAISNMGNQEGLAKVLKMTSQNVSEMLHGTVLSTLETLRIISKIAKVDVEDVYENINCLTFLRKNGIFRPKLSLNLTPEVAEWFGQALGDGGIPENKRYLSFSNTEINTVKFHSGISKDVLGIEDKQFLLVLKIPQKALNDLEKWEENFRNLKIIYSTPSKNSKNQNYISGDLIIPNKGLTKFFDSIKIPILEAIKNSKVKIKAKFISGLYAAEGSPQKYELFFVMKDSKIVSYVKEILEDIGIKTSKIKIRKDGTYDLRISRRENILKFKDIISFGHHERKNIKLNNFIKSYKELQLPKQTRHKQIINKIENNNGVSISEIANNLKVTYSLAWLRIRELEKTGFITRQNGKCYLKS